MFIKTITTCDVLRTFYVEYYYVEYVFNFLNITIVKAFKTFSKMLCFHSGFILSNNAWKFQ